MKSRPLRKMLSLLLTASMVLAFMPGAVFGEADTGDSLSKDSFTAETSDKVSIDKDNKTISLSGNAVVVETLEFTENWTLDLGGYTLSGKAGGKGTDGLWDEPYTAPTDGSDGVVPITVSDGILTITGGGTIKGGDGAEGGSGALWQKHPGGHGGVGAAAIEVAGGTVNVDCPLTVEGGKGGSGGDASIDDTHIGTSSGEYFAAGGNGGKGGSGITVKASGQLIFGNLGKLTIQGGNSDLGGSGNPGGTAGVGGIGAEGITPSDYSGHIGSASGGNDGTGTGYLNPEPAFQNGDKTYYKVTVNGEYKGAYETGTRVTIELDPLKSGYEISNYDINNVETATLANNTIVFTIPKNNVGITYTPVPIKVRTVSITSKTVNLKVDETKALYANVTPAEAPNKAIRWNSKNISVATVDSSSGVVTAVGVGNATITATAADGGGASGTCTVTVTPAQLQAPTDPTLTGKTAAWNAVQKASGYLVKLYKGDDASPVEAVTISNSSPSYTFTKIEDAGSYTFTVTAIGTKNGNYTDSDPSEKSAAVQFHKVTFDAGSEDAKKTEIVENNGKIEQPTDPIKSGYKFMGWYEEETYENEWDFGTSEVTESMTLYAKWERVSSGSITPPEPQKPDIPKGDGYETEVDKDGNVTIKVDDDYEIKDVLVNGESKGPVTSLSGLKTGDKVEIIVISKEEKHNAYLKEGVENTSVDAWSESTKGRIRVYFKKEAGFKVDGYEFYRSTKKTNFGKKPYYVSQKTTAKYLNNTKNLKKGTRYYYKIRGYRTIAGEKVYTKWSNIASRPAK